MQKYIGNIIVNNLNYKIDKCFNKLKLLDDVNNDLPTLIIGLEKARNSISDFNILKREYGDNKTLWWTLSKMEKRVDYDKNIIDFYNFCINNILKGIKYKNIDLINIKYNEAKEYIRFIRNNRKKFYYIDNGKFIFVYDTESDVKDKNIYGISLSTAEFLGINKKNIIELVKNNNRNIELRNFYSIPNNVRKMINDDIVSKMVLNEFF